MFQNHEISSIQHYLSSYSFPKPAGASSGHAIGEPIEKAIYNFLKQQSPQEFFKQYELLNTLFSQHPQITGSERLTLLPTQSLQHLLNRGEDATAKWSTTELFEEKQNDTADIIRLMPQQVYGLLDVKTFNTKKNGQPPNIISAYKLAELCKILLQENQFDHLDICYLSVDWIEKSGKIYTEQSHFVDLFRIDHKDLYINWAAAMQIQFHPSKVSQYQGDVDKKLWAQEYLKKYIKSAEKRIQDMQTKFINPYLDYI